MKIAEVLTCPGWGAYYVEDLAALQARPTPEADRYLAEPVTPSFRRVREPAEVLSVGLRLEDGRVAWGDCVGVCYGGKAGRDPVFRSASARLPELAGGEWSLESLAELELPQAVHYGLSQALVAAQALSWGVSQTEVWCRLFDLPLPSAPLALHGSSGNARRANADKMMVRRLASLPAGQVDDLQGQVGPDGRVLLDYASWLRQRLEQLGATDYRPTVHLDVHGALGRIFEDDELVKYVGRLAETVAPYPLRLESLVVEASRQAQIERLGRLKGRVPAQLVVDEWANTYEDVVAFVQAGVVDMVHLKVPDLGSLLHSFRAIEACRQQGIKSLLGGSCIETETSARACVHLGLAARPDLLLCKPGMGVDEAIMLVHNEMQRTLAEFTGSR
ncbi:MAG: methylaspartate ammonia-lyase [Candidatus Eremiobacteraeota bacterium]|nr:methylaspartate ammonia-lyase [Candidatus Eremiobacteraeota bacterium]